MAIDKEKLNQIRREAEKIKEAGSAVAQNMLTLWAAQLDIALAIEDEETIKRIISQPTLSPAFYDNHGCDCRPLPNGAGSQCW